MTPFEIGIMLHYHASAEDHPACVNNVPIWRGTIDRFLAEHLVELEPKDKPRGITRTYRLTERGTCYVQALQAMPLPLPRWVVPAMEYEPGPDA